MAVYAITVQLFEDRSKIGVREGFTVLPYREFLKAVWEGEHQ